MFIILAFSASGSLASVLKRQAEQSAPVPSKCPPKPESVPDLDLARVRIRIVNVISELNNKSKDYESALLKKRRFFHLWLRLRVQN